MLLDDHARDRQADAGALNPAHIARPAKAFEDVRDVVHGNADAAIAYLKHGYLPSRRFLATDGQGDRPPGLYFTAFEQDFHHTPDSAGPSCQRSASDASTTS